MPQGNPYENSRRANQAVRSIERKSPRRRVAANDFGVRYLRFGIRWCRMANAPLGWEDELGFHFGVP